MSWFDCPTCYTSKNDFRRGVIKCAQCYGKGCNKCDNTGLIKCQNCKGVGKVERK